MRLSEKMTRLEHAMTRVATKRFRKALSRKCCTTRRYSSSAVSSKCTRCASSILKCRSRRLSSTRYGLLPSLQSKSKLILRMVLARLSTKDTMVESPNRPPTANSTEGLWSADVPMTREVRAQRLVHQNSAYVPAISLFKPKSKKGRKYTYSSTSSELAPKKTANIALCELELTGSPLNDPPAPSAVIAAARSTTAIASHLPCAIAKDIGSITCCTMGSC
mmetsp:Transcript_9491/g.30350  ORF Transcript_9491/g.30350 Transcript_9491/m.30350 type:complete len:220 (-) Transcript_9491:591-1250(-)